MLLKFALALLSKRHILSFPASQDCRCSKHNVRLVLVVQRDYVSTRSNRRSRKPAKLYDYVGASVFNGYAIRGIQVRGVRTKCAGALAEPIIDSLRSGAFKCAVSAGGVVDPANRANARD